MPRMPGKKLPYVLDKLGMGAGAAARHVDRGGARVDRLAAKVGRRMKPGTAARAGADTGFAVGSSPIYPADRVARGRKIATKNALVSARQRQVGGRYAAGAIGLGSVGMYNGRNSSGSRPGPSPMTRARPGSGRNP